MFRVLMSGHVCVCGHKRANAALPNDFLDIRYKENSLIGKDSLLVCGTYDFTASKKCPLSATTIIYNCMIA